MLFRSANVNGGRQELSFLGTDAVTSKTDGAHTDTPKYWTILGGNLELIPEPGSAMTLEIEYFADITSITGGSANFLLTRFPALYLWRTCLAGAHRMRDIKRINDFTAYYTQVLAQVQRFYKRGRYGRAMQVRAA